jgi:hypothetical protein
MAIGFWASSLLQLCISEKIQFPWHLLKNTSLQRDSLSETVTELRAFISLLFSGTV